MSSDTEVVTFRLDEYYLDLLKKRTQKHNRATGEGISFHIYARLGLVAHMEDDNTQAILDKLQDTKRQLEDLSRQVEELSKAQAFFAQVTFPKSLIRPKKARP